MKNQPQMVKDYSQHLLRGCQKNAATVNLLPFGVTRDDDDDDDYYDQQK